MTSERKHFTIKTKQKMTGWARSEDWRGLNKTEWLEKMVEWKIRDDESTRGDNDDKVRNRMSRLMTRIRSKDKKDAKGGVL